MQKIEEISTNNNNGDNNNNNTQTQQQQQSTTVKTPLIGKLNGKRIFVKDSKNPPVTFKDFKNSNNLNEINSNGVS